MRVLDITFAVIGIILLLPIMLVISVLIKFTSNGSVTFHHKRVGRHCRTFNCLKFRSMVTGADRIGSYMTAKNDSRITPFGSFLRKYSLDELPQLFNVLLGHMSLVGPRPDTPMQLDIYSEEEKELRHSIRPGITGLAQVRARHVATNKNRLRYDLFYVRKQSVALYFWIIYKTIVNLITKESY
ncbi:MAG: sugar transferase [Balneolaceae bacterium]